MVSSPKKKLYGRPVVGLISYTDIIPPLSSTYCYDRGPPCSFTMQPKDSGSGNPRLQLPTEAETCHSLVKDRGDMVKNPLGSQPTTSRIFQDFRKSAVNVLPNVMGKWRFSLKFKGILGLFTKMDRLILDFSGTGLHSIKYI